MYLLLPRAAFDFLAAIGSELICKHHTAFINRWQVAIFAVFSVLYFLYKCE